MTINAYICLHAEGIGQLYILDTIKKGIQIVKVDWGIKGGIVQATTL